MTLGLSSYSKGPVQCSVAQTQGVPHSYFVKAANEDTVLYVLLILAGKFLCFDCITAGGIKYQYNL